MRNEVLIFAGLLIALIVGSMLYRSHGSRHTQLESSTTDLDRASDLMRQDYNKAAGSIRTAVAEFYVNMGKMPPDNAHAGLPAPEEYRGQTLRSATVSPDGNIDLEFDENSGNDGGHVRLVVDLSHATAMGPQWRCETQDYPNIARAIPACNYSGR
jgi:hypothetical protein